jgi:hypothetical protein
MLSHAAATYVAVHGVRIFRRAVVTTVDNQGYRDALRLHQTGVQVQGIFDARPGAGGLSVDAARAAGIPIRFRATVLDTASNAAGLCTCHPYGPRHRREHFKRLPIYSQYLGLDPIVDLATHIISNAVE